MGSGFLRGNWTPGGGGQAEGRHRSGGGVLEKPGEEAEQPEGPGVARPQPPAVTETHSVAGHRMWSGTRGNTSLEGRIPPPPPPPDCWGRRRHVMLP